MMCLLGTSHGLMSLTYHALDDLVFAVVFLHLQQVVAEVQDVEAPLLAQQGDDHATGPVEAVTKALPAKTGGKKYALLKCSGWMSVEMAVCTATVLWLKRIFLGSL